MMTSMRSKGLEWTGAVEMVSLILSSLLETCAVYLAIHWICLYEEHLTYLIIVLYFFVICRNLKMTAALFNTWNFQVPHMCHTPHVMKKAEDTVVSYCYFVESICCQEFYRCRFLLDELPDERDAGLQVPPTY